jgi:hypothetical protein
METMFGGQAMAWMESAAYISCTRWGELRIVNHIFLGLPENLLSSLQWMTFIFLRQEVNLL